MRWTTMEDRQPRLAELGVSVSLPRVSNRGNSPARRYAEDQPGRTVPDRRRFVVVDDVAVVEGDRSARDPRRRSTASSPVATAPRVSTRCGVSRGLRTT